MTLMHRWLRNLHFQEQDRSIPSSSSSSLSRAEGPSVSLHLVVPSLEARGDDDDEDSNGGGGGGGDD
jgi:hypothetical protein